MADISEHIYYKDTNIHMINNLKFRPWPGPYQALVNYSD